MSPPRHRRLREDAYPSPQEAAMWRGMPGVMLMTFLTIGGRMGHAQAGSPRIRPEDAAIRALIDRGTRAIRDVPRIDRRARQLKRHRLCQIFALFRRRACVSGLASAATDARWLLIKIDRFGPARRRPDVRCWHTSFSTQMRSRPIWEITDLASFQRSFASRGWKHAAGFNNEAGNIEKGGGAESNPPKEVTVDETGTAASD